MAPAVFGNDAWCLYLKTLARAVMLEEQNERLSRRILDLIEKHNSPLNQNYDDDDDDDEPNSQ